MPNNSAACSNTQCGASSAITEQMTFGTGYLDPNGYWEFPCRACAAAWDARREQRKDELRQQMIDRGELPLKVALYMNNAVWLNEPAWPEADMDVEQITRSIQDRRKRDKR